MTPPAFLPTHAQELLLRACLCDGDEASDALRRWRRKIDIDHIELACARLLPMLPAALIETDPDDPVFRKRAEVKRRAWAANQVLFRRAARVAKALAEAGIPIIALKGAVLAARYYPHPAQRPMSDLDLLVRFEDALAAVGALQRLGWRTAAFEPRSPADLAARHAIGFRLPDEPEGEIDIHWRLLQSRPSQAAMSALWRHATPLVLGGQTLLAPGAADMLAHVCAHGARWNVHPPIRWIADAAMVIRSGEVDWDFFVLQCRTLGVCLPVSAALAYLRSIFSVAVPAGVIPALASRPPTRLERFIFETDQRPHRRPRDLPGWIAMHAHVAGATPDLGPRPLAYWRYLAAMQRGRQFSQIVDWTLQKARGPARRR
jgi:hypothetical protein